MANPFVQTLIFIAGVANGVSLSQAVAAAGALTLNGSLVAGGVATFDAARRVALKSAGNDATVKFTIAGTDRYGNAISEVVTGSNNSTVLTNQDFLTVTSVTSSAATVGNIIVGTSSATTIGSGPWLPCNINIAPVQIEFWTTVASANPSTHTLEYTPDDPNAMVPPGGTAQVAGSGSPPATAPYPGSGSVEESSFSPPQAWADTTIVNRAANSNTVKNGVPFHYRLTINSGTTAVTLQAIQAGIRN